MHRQPIPVEKFAARPFNLLDKQWFLLTSGNYSEGNYNAMTISWGSLGVIWNRPFVQVVVRPQRYTFEFMEKYPSFSLCAFPDDCRTALNLLGTKSGRDGNKIVESGLKPIAAAVIAAPIFEQAELAIECRKLYWQDFDPTHFLDPGIVKNYPDQDYHRIYFGEIMAISGTFAYRA